jgi:hypothetical protein
LNGAHGVGDTGDEGRASVGISWIEAGAQVEQPVPVKEGRPRRVSACLGGASHQGNGHDYSGQNGLRCHAARTSCLFGNPQKLVFALLLITNFLLYLVGLCQV